MVERLKMITSIKRHCFTGFCYLFRSIHIYKLYLKVLLIIQSDFNFNTRIFIHMSSARRLIELQCKFCFLNILRINERLTELLQSRVVKYLYGFV